MTRRRKEKPKMKIMDAEYTQVGTRDPVAYSEKCRRQRRRRYRRIGAFVQRLAVGAAVCITSAVLLAVMMGAWR